MDALLWKKFKEIKNQRIRTAVILAFPFLISIILIINPVHGVGLSASLPLFNLMICWLLMFNIEDFVFAEVVFGTGINIWKMWCFDMLYSIITAAFYTGIEILLLSVLGAGNYRIDIVKLFVSFCCGCGLICFATCYICDYSKLKNYISSIGGIFNFLLLGYICVTYGQAVWLIKYLNPLFAVSIILAVFSIVIVYKFSRIEKFVNNIRKLSDGYENKNFIDE
ncbi:hypothetical protein [[Clostridium] polysaccharolyticum]|uniref:Uncharacterized protein n=1 Tax=[Clostridium] polysaccharolyticum TaxID=29364 RepID=A0A1I0B9I2_9FIRM|nr:hypothetical protein [[Clostridium] polysaccharolyticum]SET03369.1 hypothetical protein SAMN04487772_10729 [[Clostridium] polysaccharolyticum]